MLESLERANQADPIVLIGEAARSFGESKVASMTLGCLPRHIYMQTSIPFMQHARDQAMSSAQGAFQLFFSSFRHSTVICETSSPTPERRVSRSLSSILASFATENSLPLRVSSILLQNVMKLRKMVTAR